MNTAHVQHFTRNPRTIIARAVLARVATLFMLLAGGNIAASEAPAPIDGELKSGLTPLSVLIDQPYVHDPNFSGGNWQHFGNGSNIRSFHGRKTVRLSNGDIVTAGLAPRYSAAANPSNGMWNIGLVRLTANGVNSSWGATSPHHVSSSVVVYPNLPDPHYADIKDIKVYGDFIYVLADRWRQNVLGPSNSLDGFVVVFRTNGTFVGYYGALNLSVGLDETGAAMDFYQRPTFPNPSPVHLYVAGTSTSSDGHSFVTLVRMIRHSDGTLTRDTAFGPDGNRPYADYELPDSYCATSAQPCRIIANDISITQRGIGNTASPRIYIGGTARRAAPNNWGFVALRTNATGALDTSLCTNTMCQGYAMLHDVGGARRAEVHAIVARSVNQLIGQDEILLIGDVERSDSGPYRGAGVGVAKLNNQGYLVNGFGSNGVRLFGGCAGDSAAICTLMQNSDHPRAAILANDQLVIAGWSGSRALGIGAQHVRQPMLAVVDATTGSVLEDRLFPTQSPSSGYGEALDIRDGGNNTFLLAGYGGRPDATDTVEFITTRVRSDRIFGNGFQQ